MKRHLVVCGTGPVGSFVVDVLLGKALHVRATTSRKEQVSQRGPIAWTYLDIATGQGMEQAFAGINRAVLVLPIAAEKPMEALARCVREAKRRRVEKLVVITDAREQPDECERLLERAGVRHEVVRSVLDDDPRRLAAAAVLLLTHDDIPGHDRGYPGNRGVLNAA